MTEIAEITQELMALKSQIMELYVRDTLKKCILNIWSLIYRNKGYHWEIFFKNFSKNKRANILKTRIAFQIEKSVRHTHLTYVYSFYDKGETELQ